MKLDKIYMVKVAIEKPDSKVPVSLGALTSTFGEIKDNFGDNFIEDSAKIYLISKDKRQQFEQFEKKVQQDIKSVAAVYPLEEVDEESWLFMTEDMYQDFLKRFTEYEQEYYQMRDGILTEYEDGKAEFLSSLQKVGVVADTEEARKQTEEKLPSKKQLEEKLKIRINAMDVTASALDNEEIMSQFVPGTRG